MKRWLLIQTDEEDTRFIIIGEETEDILDPKDIIETEVILRLVVEFNDRINDGKYPSTRVMFTIELNTSPRVT